MSFKIERRAYVDMFGPTKGDRVRLAGVPCDLNGIIIFLIEHIDDLVGVSFVLFVDL